jgi:phosphoenolpyruvate carboxylase
MKNDPEFCNFGKLYDEFLETKRLLLKIAGHKELMENYPDGIASIQIRDVLSADDTDALLRINELNKETVPNDLIKVYEKLLHVLFEILTQ